MIRKVLATLLAATLLSSCSSISISERQAEYRIDRGINFIESEIFFSSNNEPVGFSIRFDGSTVDFVDTKATPVHQDIDIVLSGTLTINHPKYLIDTPVEILISANAAINNEQGKLLMRDFIIDDVLFKELYSSLSKDLRAPIANASLAQIESQLNNVVLINTKRNDDNYSKKIERNRITLVRHNTNN